MEGASECGSPSEFGFGLCDDFPEEAIHPLLIEDYEDEAETRRKLKVQAGNIYKPVDGLTQLHRALRQTRETRIKLLIDAYQEDFEKVGSYLEKEYRWDSADREWLKKTILVASSEEECRTAKRLETKQINHGDLREAVFVLLQHPVEDEEVAILHPDESTRLPVIQLINRLIPNGFLSWSCQETQGRRETFMEMAASRGLNHVIDRLYELGAPIAIPYHNPLLSACRSNQKDTIQLLLAKHFDSFDCTIRDEQNLNAILVAMYVNDSKMFDLCLEKLMAYRQKYYNETESQAFASLFRFENEMSTSSSIFTYCRDRVKACVERAIEKYGIDLAYQWKEVTILICMLSKNIATEYCYQGIRNDPKLLGMMVQDVTTVLHEVLRLQHTEFLCEMYQQNPEVKEYFNGKGGFNALRTALCYKNHKIVQFILKHHMDFLMNDEQKLKDIVCSSGFSKEYYEKHYKFFIRCFPEFEEEIELTTVQAKSEGYFYGVEQSFANVGVDVSKIDDLPKPSRSHIRGSRGETLLHLAVERDNKELFLQLIEAGCDLDALDNEANHPIHFLQSESMLDLIVDRYPEGHNLVQLTNQDGLSVLHKVCSLRMEDEPLLSLLQKVIDLGADVHQLTNEGESAIFFVGSTAALEVLRKHNVQLDSESKLAETALLRHLRYGNVWMARALLRYGHQLPTFQNHAHLYLEPMLRRNRDLFTGDYQDFLEEYQDITKLMFDSLFSHSREEASRVFNKVCVSAFNFVAAKFLEFDYDLDYNYQDEYRNTPIVGLLSYMEEPNKHIVEKLLQKGINLHIRNNRDQDALLAFVERFRNAKWCGHDAGTAQLLMDHGAAVNTADEDGNTPLHLAFRDGEVELIEVLVRNGADLGVKNKAGKAPLQMASAVNQELFYFLR